MLQTYESQTSQLQLQSQQSQAMASYVPTAQDTDLIIRVLVEARANIKLALDVLKHQHGLDLQLADLVPILKDHMPDLKSSMEVVATLELFNLMPQLHKTLVENLSNLEGSDAVTAYMKLMDLITKQVSSNDLNININDQRWRQVPRDLQRVYAALEASGQLDQVLLIEHNPDD